ncbi:DUF3870 domain-containing protein [Pseudogracilibacillus sp. SO30301A]|uniref:DUF3870 domain-containing protein n=1 Tax=Pseudogracilibacillus sp. SO30301A TaxID=3098291 RepID=UPI00300E418D
MKKELRSFIVTAYAKAPQNTSMFEVFKYIGVVLEIDRESRTIINAEFTFITDLAKNYFSRLVIGHNMDEGADKILKKIEESYFAPSSNSIIVAIRSAFRRYEERAKQILD